MPTVKFNPEIATKMRELHELGVPRTRIAAKFGVDPLTVRRWLDPEYHMRVALYRKNWGSIRITMEDRDLLRAEAKRRGLSLARLVHDLIEQGIPHDVPEAAE